jgi:hypothetical protein
MQHRRLLRVDLAARAREHIEDSSFARAPSDVGPRFHSCRVATFRVSISAADHVPARSFRRSLRSTSLGRRSRRARPLPLSRCPARRLDLRARVGARRERPPSNDRSLQLTDFVFKDDRPKSRRTSHHLCSHVDARACGCTPQRPLRRTDRSRLEALSAPIAAERRTSDAPSPRASPAELCPPASARDR